MGFLLHNQNIHLHQLANVAAEALNPLPTSRQPQDGKLIGLMEVLKN